MLKGLRRSFLPKRWLRKDNTTPAGHENRKTALQTSITFCCRRDWLPLPSPLHQSLTTKTKLADVSSSALSSHRFLFWSTKSHDQHESYLNLPPTYHVLDMQR